MSDTDRLKEVHLNIQQLKREKKELMSMVKDELAQNERYQEILEAAENLRTEKKSIELTVKESAPTEAARIDELAIEIKSNEELLSDLAFNLLMANQTVEIEHDDNRYIPKFSVRFKKD